MSAVQRESVHNPADRAEASDDAARAAKRRSRPRLKRDESLVACVTTTGAGRTGQIRAVLATTSGGLDGDGPALRLNVPLPRRIGEGTVIEAVSFDAGAWTKLESWLRDRRVGRVVRVLPTSATVIRPLEVPSSEGDREGVAEALALLAEAAAPSAPAWRRSAGVLPPVRIESPPAAVATIWIASDEDGVDGLEEWEGGDGVSTPVALAGLAHALGAAFPNEPAPAFVAMADERSGSVGLWIEGSRATIARGARAPAADDRRWSDSVRAIAEESAAAAEGAAPEQVHPAGISISDEQGRSWDEDQGGAWGWVRDWGLCVGGLAIALSKDPATRPLASMHARERIPMAPWWEEAATYFARPRRAGVLIAASIAVMIGAPLLSAWARVQILEKRAAAAGLETRLADAEQRVGFYQLLRDRRWPMSKLLADIAGSAPIGVEVEALELAQGEQVQVRGTAEKAELVSKFRENLGATRIFTQITTPSVTSEEGRVRFQLTAQVPPGTATYEGGWAQGLDFTKQSLGQRLYGDEWSPTSGREMVDAGAHRDGRASRERAGSAPDRASADRTASAAEPFTPPPPISDAEIAQLDVVQAMREFGRRRAAAVRTTDPAIKQRLMDESSKAQQRMLEARDALGGDR